MKFTAETVAAVPFTEGGQRKYACDDEVGLHLVVGKATKAFVVQVDIVDPLGRRVSRKRTLGRFPEMTPAEARRAARVARVEMAQEGAPPKRQALTVAGALAEMISVCEEDVAAGRRSARTLKYWRWGQTVLAPLHGVPLAALSHDPAALRSLAAEAARDRGPMAARAAVVTLKRAYNAAFKARLDPDLPAWNPAQGVRLSPPRVGSDRAPIDLPAWFAQVERLESPIRRAFHVACLLSGSRAGALAVSRWEHVDVRRRTLLIPEPKGGAKRAYSIPLSRELARVLILARRAGRVMFPGSPFIFPAGSAAGHITEWKEPRDRLALWGHDLRRAYRTAAAQAGVSPTVSMVLLNHASGGVHDSAYLQRGALGDLLALEQQRVSTHVRRLAGDPAILRTTKAR